MAALIGIKWNRGVEKYARALKRGSLPAELRKHLRVATQRSAKLVEARVRRTIKSGDLEPNATLTQEIKGSDKPLVDRGQLFQSVTSRILSEVDAFIGILRTDGVYNIAVTLHDGRTIKVTQKMRNLFDVLWKASTGGMRYMSIGGRAGELLKRKPTGWLPLKKSTTVILIKARPFIKIAFADDTLRRSVVHNWERAVDAFFRDLARR